MNVEDREFDLIKINMALGGAAFTAVQFGIDGNNTLIATGIAALLFSLLYQYLNLMPGFHFGYVNEDTYREDVWDTFILLSITGFLFLAFGIGGPSLDKEINILPQGARVVLLYTLIGSIVFLRFYNLHSINDNREMTAPFALMIGIPYIGLILLGILAWIVLGF